MIFFLHRPTNAKSDISAQIVDKQLLPAYIHFIFDDAAWSMALLILLKLSAMLFVLAKG